MDLKQAHEIADLLEQMKFLENCIQVTDKVFSSTNKATIELEFKYSYSIGSGEVSRKYQPLPYKYVLEIRELLFKDLQLLKDKLESIK